MEGTYPEEFRKRLTKPQPYDGPVRMQVMDFVVFGLISRQRDYILVRSFGLLLLFPLFSCLLHAGYGFA